MHVYVGEIPTCDIVYLPLMWNQKLFMSKSNTSSSGNSEVFEVLVHKGSSEVMHDFVCFFRKTAYGLTKNVRTFTSETYTWYN